MLENENPSKPKEKIHLNVHKKNKKKHAQKSKQIKE
jgi:hypothetical protein